MKKTRAAGPHIPAPYTKADVVSVQALLRGEADAIQQRRALGWILQQASGMYEFQYYGTDRDTAFALGRGFVGQQIVKLTKLNLMNFKEEGA